MDELDKTNGAALHAQLTEILAASIHQGAYAAGSRLPSEARLQETFEVSRSVVRQSLESLTAMGLIERVKGSGSRVLPRQRYHRLAQSRVGLAAQLIAAGTPASTRVLSWERLDEPAPEFDSDATGTLVLERLRSIATGPIALIRTWLPLPLAELLRQDDLTDASLHEVMGMRYGTSFSGGTRHVRAIAANSRSAELLGVKIGAPVLVLDGITTDDDGRVVEKFETHHRADLISLDFTL